MKAGWRTTEFWVMLVTSLVGMLASLGVLPLDFPKDEVIGLVASGAAIVAYIISRAWVKAAYLKPVPPTEEV